MSSKYIFLMTLLCISLDLISMQAPFKALTSLLDAAGQPIVLRWHKLKTDTARANFIKELNHAIETDYENNKLTAQEVKNHFQLLLNFITKHKDKFAGNYQKLIDKTEENIYIAALLISYPHLARLLTSENTLAVSKWYYATNQEEREKALNAMIDAIVSISQQGHPIQALGLLQELKAFVQEKKGFNEAQLNSINTALDNLSFIITNERTRQRLYLLFQNLFNLAQAQG